MKKTIITLAALAALAAPATASAGTRHCHVSRTSQAVVMNIVAHNATCATAVGLVEDQWALGASSWVWYRGDWRGPWRLTRRWDDSQMPPEASVRAARGRSWITWIEGT